VPEQALTINVSRQPSAVVVELIGSADIGRSEFLAEKLAELATEPGVWLVLDLRGLGALIQAHNICRHSGGQVR